MNKEKILVVIRKTVRSLKEDLLECQEYDDDNGVYYYRGRIEGLEQLLDVIEKGYFDQD